jgi:shikimate dehydrogenase
VAQGLTRSRQEAEPPDQYGVVGHPVAHSRSPFIHGLFAKETSQNIVYRLHDIEPAQFRAEMLRLFTSGVRGLNVTVPFKPAAAEFVNDLTPRAALAEAVNTITLREDHSLAGDNTDGAGLVRDLVGNIGIDVADKRIVILGAGGATRGVLGPLLEERPRRIVIANRTLGKAQSLAERFAELGSVEAAGFDSLSAEPADLVINATSASLRGEMPPLPATLIAPGTVCYDMAYGPGDTPFVAWGKRHGAARAVKGYGMLVEQAAESFFLWRQVRPNTRAALAALLKQAGGS